MCNRLALGSAFCRPRVKPLAHGTSCTVCSISAQVGMYTEQQGLILPSFPVPLTAHDLTFYLLIFHGRKVNARKHLCRVEPGTRLDLCLTNLLTKSYCIYYTITLILAGVNSCKSRI